MKIKTAKMAYEEVLALPAPLHEKPIRQRVVFRILLLVLSLLDLWRTRFTYETIGLEKLGREEPCLVLMNHSSFIDLKIAARLLVTRPYHVICTADGFVGKRRLLRWIGCIPTRKFMMDVTLVRDMVYAVRELKSSILMFPEASYSFDGTQTLLPESLGKCLKLLRVPVIMIRTDGAFARDPLYNDLQRRKVRVSAKVEYLLSGEEIARMSAQELNALLQEKFTFDHFRWQQENRIMVHRMLYKCPHCRMEGQMQGQGIRIECRHCGRAYELTEYGYLQSVNEETPAFTHIPDWYRWERECVRQELEEGAYRLEAPVLIYMMVNTDCLYQVGEGTLIHSIEGFHLTGCDGKLDYTQEPSASYSLYSDFYWYEIGDVISIGDTRAQYYCFPQIQGDIVAKARLAAEELYKMVKTAGR